MRAPLISKKNRSGVASDFALSWEHELALQAQGYRVVAGLDEAGRGCLAGPVVASAVILGSPEQIPLALNDSKKLSRVQRRQLYSFLTTTSSVFWHVGIASVEEIDQINILRASHLAMQRALEGLRAQIEVDFILVDGLPIPLLGAQQKALVGGDGISPSIAAASIIAKETRDRLMEKLHQRYPSYGFAQHKGYGTRQHLASLAQAGLCPEHRRSFAPVRQLTLMLDT